MLKRGWPAALVLLVAIATVPWWLFALYNWHLAAIGHIDDTAAEVDEGVGIICAGMGCLQLSVAAGIWWVRVRRRERREPKERNA